MISSNALAISASTAMTRDIMVPEMYKPWFTTATDLRYVRMKVSEWLFLSWLTELTVWYMSCRATKW